MLKKHFKGLSEGQHVHVSGHQDAKHFDGHAGKIIKVSPGCDVLIRFDKWFDGHGLGEREWYFYEDDAKNFTITVEAAKKASKKSTATQAYKGNGKHTWEHVVDRVRRLRVPGGWLYGRLPVGYGREEPRDLVFVPMPEVVSHAI